MQSTVSRGGCCSHPAPVMGQSRDPGGSCQGGNKCSDAACVLQGESQEVAGELDGEKAREMNPSNQGEFGFHSSRREREMGECGVGTRAGGHEFRFGHTGFWKLTEQVK